MTNACTQNTDRECREEDCCLDNRPKVIKYIEEIMPIIVTTCPQCNEELFRSMTYEIIKPHHTLCQDCYVELKQEVQDLKKYFSFTIKVVQFLTSRLNFSEQREGISLTYAKMIWPDLWTEDKETRLKQLRSD